MLTDRVYPFIHAKIFDLEDNNDRKDVVFDAREVESYELWEEGGGDEDECVKVNFKSGREMTLYLELDQDMYPDYDLASAIDNVQYTHFWHDNVRPLPKKSGNNTTTTTF